MSIKQQARMDAAALRDRIEADKHWFAERHAELAEMRRAAKHYTAMADELRSRT